MKQQKVVSLINGKQRGFTLVEFMVASVLGLVVIAGAGSLYSYTKRLNDIGMTRVSTLQDLRSAATMIGQDARSAGVFGCASLGRRYAPDVEASSAGIEIVQPTGLPAIAQLQTLDSGVAGSPDGRSAGVRWIPNANVAATLQDMGVNNLTVDDNTGGMLLFYYGEGSLSFNSSNGTNQVVFNTNEQHPNQAVKTVLTTQPGGYVVAAGCNAIVITPSNGQHSAATFAVDNVPDVVKTASSPNTPHAILPHSDMILQRYKVVAYVVGKIADEPMALYRFEFGNYGDAWSAPQQLAKNVKSMSADYLFVTDCPSALITDQNTGATVSIPELNGQSFTVQSADDGNAILDIDPNKEAQGPSSVRVTLTYDFPNLRGGNIATGDQDQEFNISAVVRGGNVCASRKVVQ
ncbi:MAG: prepilin-type N-terminal cleavage/methylation domain-containing protein [Neisseriaceae bacterium]|nr:prepilin-type N-terminal cleavage/methylation domain-containing protein [Neisseriaceae bacterium]